MTTKTKTPMYAIVLGTDKWGDRIYNETVRVWNESWEMWDTNPKVYTEAQARKQLSTCGADAKAIFWCWKVGRSLVGRTTGEQIPADLN